MTQREYYIPTYACGGGGAGALTGRPAFMGETSIRCERDKDYYRRLLDRYFPKQVSIKRVIFNPPATIVFWTDGMKTVVKAQNGEPFDREKGLAMAILKGASGNTGRYFNEIRRWCEDKEDVQC